MALHRSKVQDQMSASDRCCRKRLENVADQVQESNKNPWDSQYPAPIPAFSWSLVSLEEAERRSFRHDNYLVR